METFSSGAESLRHVVNSATEDEKESKGTKRKFKRKSKRNQRVSRIIQKASEGNPKEIKRKSKKSKGHQKEPKAS